MRVLLLLCGLFFATMISAQEARLAQQYFRDGEYEKASVLYEKLAEANPENPYYFDRYVDCLLSLEQYDECERAIKRQLRRQPDNIFLYVTYGKLFERQYKDNEAREQFELAISKMPKERYTIVRLANSFMSLTKYDLAIAAYEKGAKLLKDDLIFAYNLGDLYRRKGDTPKMIESYLNSLDENPDRLDRIKTTMQRYLADEDYTELQKQLYTRLQSNENAIYYPELLAWVFIQKQDYRNAFRQVRALDRRLKENGSRVFKLAEIAANAKDYDAAIEAYEYIVEQKGITSSYYIDAKREALRARKNKITEGFDYTEVELRELEKQYEGFLDEFGRSKLTASIVSELANFEALYLNDLDKAVALLTEMIEYPNVDRYVEAYGKLSLADYYLMKGDIWEATLLYSQVDKAFKEDILGHEARFRNAKLSYYAGDFQWAQAQFEVLKASTSKLIANDALDLSVFIMDNLGLDTTAQALTLYSQADLLVFQNRFADAFQKMDTLLQEFPEHALEDDVLYLKAQIYSKKREYEKAAETYQRIVENYSDGIRADNSLFRLAGLYENQLNDLEKAKSLYETLFIDYSGSTFAVEARKRFRILRGDDIQ